MKLWVKILPNNDLNWSCYASLPKDTFGLVDECELIRLCGKFEIPMDYLYELEPYEFLLYLEGKLDNQREFFEFMCYSLYSSVAQVLGGKKGKKFENPFEKQKEKKVATKEEEEFTMEKLGEIFGIEVDMENWE